MKNFWCADAARQLGISTRKLIELMYNKEIRYVMIDGIAHIPEDAIEEYRNRS